VLAAAASSVFGTIDLNTPGAAGAEEDASSPLDEADDDDLPERKPVQEDRRDEAADSDRTQDVGCDHQPLPVDAIAGHAGGQAEQYDRQELRERHDTGLSRRVRHGESEQREGDQRRTRPDGREQLPRLEQHEVPVAPQGVSAASPSGGACRHCVTARGCVRPGASRASPLCARVFRVCHLARRRSIRASESQGRLTLRSGF
jgi:hypothetical protein